MRTVGLLIYWTVFATQTYRAAWNPGLVSSDTPFVYPWGAVWFTWSELAVLTLGLAVILRRPSARWHAWWRVGIGLYVAVLLLVVAMGAGTDFPGYVYVPSRFALTTLLGLTGLGVVRLIDAARRATRAS